MQAPVPQPVEDHGDYWVNAAGRQIPKVIPGYGPARPFAGAFGTAPKTEGLPPMRALPLLPPRGGANKIIGSMAEALRACGAHDGMTISFHHHLRGGDGILVPTIMELRKMGIRNINLAPSSLHGGQSGLIECFKDGTVTNIQTGANDALGISVTAGDLKGMMVVRSHGARVRAIREGDIQIDIAVIGASECDNQGNCNGLHGKSAFGPMAYSAIDARLAKHVIVVTDNMCEYPCTPISIPETFVDHVVVWPSLGDNKKIVSGTTRLTTDPQQLLIGEYCARLMDALGLLTNDLVFQAGSGGTSLTSMTALSAKLKAKGVSAKMANGGTTCILVDMLKKGLVRKLTTCQSFDLSSVKSMCEDYPRHVETDIDQYANPNNSGNICNQLDVMVAGATEVDVHFNVNVNTHSDGSFQHNTGGHQDTAAGAKLCIVTMPVARRANPGVVDEVTTITTPGECIGAVVTEEGVAINPRRTDLLEKLRGKTEAELGFKLMTIEELRNRGIEKAGRRHTRPRTQDRIIGVIEWRDGTVLDVVRQPLARKDLGSHARVKITTGQPSNLVEVDCLDPNPFITAAEVERMGRDMLAQFGLNGIHMKVTYDFAVAWAVAAKMEVELRRALPGVIPASTAFNLFEQKAYPAPQHDRPLRRSHLYIPATDPYMMNKAGQVHADGVIFDIEDAVAPDMKDYARILVRHGMRGGVDFGTTERMMRINGVNPTGFLDLETILPHATIDVIVVPKVETAAEVHQLEAKICEILHVERSPVLLLPLIESALGVENAFDIVRASPNIVAISMGLEDYTQDRGVERTESDEESQWALNRVANAACVAGIQMVDVVFSTLDDVEGLEKHIARARKMGFFGKRCIHPNQVGPINRGFQPEKPDVDESMSAVQTYLKAPAGTGVVKITSKKGKSKMVDKPVLLRALRCLKLALACQMIPTDPWARMVTECQARL
eukprot:GAFH01000777.1.p1 GENE.GAFH01000777.1~~GAFH01000777.1.p1  ORF type:complete len:960 (-),score=438.52 GAFH01000777.1:293-3142(-)